MRKRPDGQSTSNLILSAHNARNYDVFPLVLKLHVPEGSVIADVTFGKGVFWRKVPEGLYTLLATDLATGTDCRDLPYDDGSIDAVVLDPPYVEGFFRKQGYENAGSGSHGNLRSFYSAGVNQKSLSRHHQAVLDLYFGAFVEADRVLRPGGVLIVKTMDEVSGRKQRWTHVELMNAFEAHGYTTKDLFVVVRPQRPSVSRIVTQAHARKNHSYFLVFRKPKR